MALAALVALVALVFCNLQAAWRLQTAALSMVALPAGVAQGALVA